jgi:hypothetical protein
MLARGPGAVVFLSLLLLSAAPASIVAAGPRAAPDPSAKPAAPSADDDELAAVCRRVLCRTPRPMHLRLAGGKSFDFTAPGPTPIVSGSLVTVMAGEKVLVEGTLKGGALVDLIAVKAITHPERTLIFQLKQDPTIGDGTTMILTVKSPFAGVVKYRLGMMPPDSEKLFKTSCCPLSQGHEVFETWPHPIFQLAATDFRIVDPKSAAAMRCE